MKHTKLQKFLEDKIEALLLSRAATINEEALTESAHLINTYNLLYQTKFRKSYIVRGTENE